MPRASFALVRDANFRALWIGQLVSIAGDRFTYLALLAVVVAHARVPENPAPELAILPLVSFLPAILFGPWIGAWVDRSDTRRVLIGSDVARGLVVLAMIPATQAGGLPALFALVFLLYAANAFFLPARSAIVPLLVPGDRLTEANSLTTFAGVTATIVGSLVGGYLVARFGWRWGFALDALTYFVSVAALWKIRMPAPEARAPQPAAEPPETASRRYRRTLEEVREGLSILLRTPRAWGATVAVMFLWTAGGVLHVAVPILTGTGGGAGDLDAGRVASGVGKLLAAAACGMVVGTVTLAARGRGGPSRRRLALALVGTGLSLAAFALAPAAGAAMGAAFAAGVFVSLLLVTTETVLQESVPAAARGRVFSLRDVAARVMVLAAAGAAGAAVGSGLPPRTAVLAVGAVTAVAGAAGLAWRRGAEGPPAEGVGAS